ncbi:DJ-1/PfpI family protein [Cellulomonas sp. zg-Y908]|uniref:DJ-1/PfpI family protein n=1 Tax=Cellulomonas wangsupingiae TaxID=2968085 RepID=A0ABY5K5P1_9CELL|nr:DJ-1/PfpI family protein [Cellulomonas wangsupingiae]MCC2333833.1 DJ-1/PfpI family protein [Cellulomonas wangsupingiae]UUI65094.1 DJ-1/PfpI family protein [Cellulomonas wangsupingiae]
MVSPVRAFLKVVLLVLAALALPAALGAPTAVHAVTGLNAPRTDAVSPTPAPVAYDPTRPTVAVVVGDAGAVASDVLAPYEILAGTGAFNVYTVAPASHPVPLTGGLDLVPDLTFAGLEKLLGGPADLVVVPAMPDVGRPTTKPVTAWLTTQADGGSVILSVCNGAAVVASAGLLDGHRATAHWLRLDEWAGTYPGVDWVAGTRYVDDGAVISTAGVLSGIDGTLHAVQRLVGEAAAVRAARAIGWPYEASSGPPRMARTRLAPSDAVVALHSAFGWDRPRIGVQLTDGVGEVELASVFDTYAQSLAADTVAVGDGPVTSRHGLTFVPRTASVAGLDRLVLPGTTDHPTVPGIDAVHPHERPGFAYDAVLQDLARTTDVATARWTAKVLEYPVDGLPLAGPSWPWALTLRPLALGVLGVLVALGARGLVRRRTRTPRGGP